MRRETTQRLMTGIGVAATASLAGVLYRGYKARNHGAADGAPGVERKITIERASGELAAMWIDALPRIFEPFAEVTEVAGGRLRWKLRGPLAKTYETSFAPLAAEGTRWTTDDGERSSFCGEVTFAAAPAERGTEVALRLGTKLPHALVATGAVAVLRRFKSLAETGEIPTLERNPSARSAISATSEKEG